MTSHTLAKYLKQLSDILFALPDSKIDKSLFKILEIVNKKLALGTEEKVTGTTPKNKKSSIDQPDFGWESLIKSLKESELDESKKILEDSKLNTIAMLSELAKRLNISISGRPKKENIIHVILKSLERDRLDETIRSRSKFKESE